MRTQNVRNAQLARVARTSHRRDEFYRDLCCQSTRSQGGERGPSRTKKSAPSPMNSDATTLKAASTPKMRIEQYFEPEAVQRMKASASRDLAIGGLTFAAHSFKAGLVEVCHLFIAPIHRGRWYECPPRPTCALSCAPG